MGFLFIRTFPLIISPKKNVAMNTGFLGMRRNRQVAGVDRSLDVSGVFI